MAAIWNHKCLGSITAYNPSSRSSGPVWFSLFLWTRDSGRPLWFMFVPFSTSSASYVVQCSVLHFGLLCIPVWLVWSGFVVSNWPTLVHTNGLLWTCLVTVIHYCGMVFQQLAYFGSFLYTNGLLWTSLVGQQLAYFGLVLYTNGPLWTSLAQNGKELTRWWCHWTWFLRLGGCCLTWETGTFPCTPQTLSTAEEDNYHTLRYFLFWCSTL